MSTAEPIVRGLVDRAGRLVEADARLADLNERAGGVVGGPLAVPQLAALARLARRLDTLISRGVFAADGDHDIDLWVRAEPVAEGVRLALTGWRPRPAWTAPAGAPIDLRAEQADWRWETDGAALLTFISVAAGAEDATDLDALLGQSWTRLFALSDDAALPAGGAQDLPATLVASGRRVLLSAVSRSDRTGGFAGWIGTARLAEPPSAPAPAPAGDAFSTRLDRALRAPLGTIITQAESIQAGEEGALSDDYAGYAADIASAGRHLLGLVDDLVDLQAIERADFVVAREALDLADIARRAAGLLQVRAAEARVTIDRPGLDETLPATGEFRRALQILVNLIGNAVRYSPEGGTVWVRAERGGTLAAVIVADQGKGIAAADQARIFEKFERVDPREPGGSGLGLYIARRLARAMGGDITVDSAPGEGARFLFTLPARAG